MCADEGTAPIFYNILFCISMIIFTKIRISIDYKVFILPNVNPAQNVNPAYF